MPQDAPENTRRIATVPGGLAAGAAARQSWRMTTRDLRQPGRRRRQGLWPAPVVLAFMLACIAVEAVLVAADRGLVGSVLWRGLAYQNGAFWSGLVTDGWRPNFAAQPVTMFATYPFLHAGLWHLVGNMAVLWILGRLVLRRMDQGSFAALYALSALGGALCFALVGSSVQPMVGASGALFGLAAAWKQRDWAERRGRGESVLPVMVDLVALVLLNLVFWVVEGGLLAWEAHLGGFLAGWFYCGLRYGFRQPPPRRPGENHDSDGFG